MKFCSAHQFDLFGRARRFLYLAMTFIALSAHSLDLDPALANAALNYAKQLYEQCPPQECFILNFGITSAFASAYFRSQIPDPEARKKYYAELMISRLSNLQPSHYKSMFSLLDKIIPSPEILNGRPVVIHRTLWSGITLDDFTMMFNEYRIHRRPDIKFGAFLIYAISYEPNSLFENLEAIDGFATTMIRDPWYAKTMRQNVIEFNGKDRAVAKSLTDTLFVDISNLYDETVQSFGRTNDTRQEMDALLPLLTPDERAKFTRSCEGLSTPSHP